MKRVVFALWVATAPGYPVYADAQSSTDTSPSPPGPALVASPATRWSLTGYLAGSYDNFDTTPALRAFDIRKRGLVFNQVAATLSFLPTSGFGAQVTVIGGEDARLIRLSETWPYRANATPVDLYNAYVQYVTGPLTLLAGKFSTLAGAEVTNPMADSTVSRSLLFTTMEPLTHTGVRAIYAFNAAFNLTAGVDNGCNFASPAPGAGRTLELGVSGTPSTRLSYAMSLYRGGSPLYGGQAGSTLQLIDLVTTFSLTPAWSLTVNGDLLSKAGAALDGRTGKAGGLAIYVSYGFSPHWQGTLRAESIDDRDGLVTALPGNTLSEVSAIASYLPTKSLRLSAELRRDHSDQSFFSRAGRTVRDQTSFELQAAFAFWAPLVCAISH